MQLVGIDSQTPTAIYRGGEEELQAYYIDPPVFSLTFSLGLINTSERLQPFL